MKIKNIMFTILTAMTVMCGCKKGDLGEPKHLPWTVPHVPNILNMFHVKVSLHQSAPYAMTDKDVVNISTSDSVLIDFTIESPDADMYQVALYKTGGGLPKQRIPVTDTMDRRTYSGQFMFYGKDLGAGSTTTYRIWANDQSGVYLGDGGRKFIINVSSDLQYYTNKRVFMPDSVQGVEPCYVSLPDGKLYSYTTGAEHSESIDFGLFSRNDTIINNPGDTTFNTATYLYSLATDPLPFQQYDIGSWTKKKTLFSKPVNKGNVNDMAKKFNTATKIESEAKKQDINLSMYPGSAAEALDKPLKSGQYIYFLTPEGKYGVILVQGSSEDYRHHEYLQLFWRIQD